MITNGKYKFEQALKESLPDCDRLDVLSGYFYFSGFAMLAEALADKRIRILVGMTLDPKLVEKLGSYAASGENPELKEFDPQIYSKMTRKDKHGAYTLSLQEMLQKHPLLDDTQEQSAMRLFLEKIKDGTLEVKLCTERHHGKAFILHRPEADTVLGAEPGVVFMGSGNFSYDGLRGQQELIEKFETGKAYRTYTEHFEEQWENAIDVCADGDIDDFLDSLKQTWIGRETPESPYDIYNRVLMEMYWAGEQQDVLTPHKITGGKFHDLMYQIEAVKQGVDIIRRNNGVIVADVVGLGKSIIASAIAKNLDMPQCVIVAPPHLVPQWETYQQQFSLSGVKVYSGGKIEAAHKIHAIDDRATLYIIDEAHRYRNELTDDYQWLHQLTRSHVDNKVILLTATPYNNRPQDLFAMVKLFQTPSRSTIQSVDNLGLRFHQLIADYNKTAAAARKSKSAQLPPHLKSQLEQIGRELRLLIEPVVIRRSRLDLKAIAAYAEDIASQGISFPEVVGPELLEYDLGKLKHIYMDTLEKITSEHGGFRGARYQAASYLIDAKAFFASEYGKYFDEHEYLLAQRNLAGMMKRLLVQRFESSKAAFRSTLEKFILSHENIIKFWEKGYVPILRRGDLPDPEDLGIDELMLLIEQGGEIDTKKVIPVPCEMFTSDFLMEVEHDLSLLRTFKRLWFHGKDVGFDPKLDRVEAQLRQMLAENPKRKIVIFSVYADTAEYAAKELQKRGLGRTKLYTGSMGNTDRQIIIDNFDAAIPKAQQKNDYDIIVATDALSEGFNLHRAGVVINYDIPYNPTRVVQRIGRINRINKKVFNEIYIYNLFPTAIGEDVTNTKFISTLKMLLINAVVGSDTKTLTPDETLESYFKRMYAETEGAHDEASWDNDYRNDWNQIKHNHVLLDKALAVPTRSRIVRPGHARAAAVSFAKRGSGILFAMSEDGQNAEVVPPEIALPLFKAAPGDTAQKGDAQLDKLFAVLRDKIMTPPPVPPVEGQRQKALTVIKALIKVKAPHKDFLMDLQDSIKDYDDLSDGELKFIASFDGQMDDVKAVVNQLEEKFPDQYLSVIKQRAEALLGGGTIIQFTEDLRR
jgi:hypothetical protein